jgi:hypothetical protein
MQPTKLLLMATAAALIATAASAQPAPAAQDQAPPTQDAAPPPPPQADPASAPAGSPQNPIPQNSPTPSDQAFHLKAGDPNVVSNGPVPDTPENRAAYGQPMSRTGKATTPSGD